VHANREKRLVSRAIFTCQLIFLALLLCHSADVGAQGELAREAAGNGGEQAAADARRQLKSALLSRNSDQRLAALRVARFINEPWIAEIVEPLCKSPDFGERVLALEAVTNSNPAQGREAFLVALTSGERALRLRGLLGLAALRDPDTVPRLVEIMRGDLDPDLRATAAEALGKVGDIKASVPLYEVIEDRYAPVRERAVLALIALGDEALSQYLIDRLKNDHYPHQAEVLRLMALVPDPDLVTAIEPFLANEDHVKRTLAAAAILSILERSGTAQP
jgi:HEAT repeat protein